jgi:two-component system sensor histidine kinase/response regulator
MTTPAPGPVASGRTIPSDVTRDLLAPVLVVDDNYAKRLSIRSVLEPLGHPMVEADSGKAAVRELMQRSFAVILMDVQMPIMDGYETARLIRTRRECEHTPIIFITALTQDKAQVSTAYAAGAVDFIFAPIVPDILRAKVSIFVDLYLKSRGLERSLSDITILSEKLREGEALARTRFAAHTRELEAANSELESFCYSVSHDLRAPLRTISGFGAILQSTHGADMPEEARRNLTLMQKGAHDMGELVDDLLAFARLGRQALTRKLLDPADVARRALEELTQPGAAPTSAVSFGPMPACRADSTLLRQLFQNLLSNALKFTRDRPDPKIELGFLRRGRDGDLTAQGAYFVRDNGVGFDARYADKLFGVFQRLHRAEDYEGTGVGLAIVERIVTRHDGQVWGESVLGKGATFYFTLGDG